MIQDIKKKIENSEATSKTIPANKRIHYSVALNLGLTDTDIANSTKFFRQKSVCISSNSSRTGTEDSENTAWLAFLPVHQGGKNL